MAYRKKFEDEGFVYELTVQPSAEDKEHLYTVSQGDGYFCQWMIKGKETPVVREVVVTDDNCEVIVFHSVEAAVKGAKDFLSI
jgi:hypothetical protein